MMTRVETIRGLPFLVTVVLALVPADSAAQTAGEWDWNAQYSAVVPIGESTRAFADGVSWRGATIDIERAATDQFSLGVSLGWHVLDEQSSRTTRLPQGAVTGRTLRTVNSVPILLAANLQLGSPRGIRPFIGAGGGTFWIENRTRAVGLAVNHTNWHWGMMGEFGLTFPRPSGATMTMSARYNRAFEVSGVEREYLTLSLGYLLGG